MPTRFQGIFGLGQALGELGSGRPSPAYYDQLRTDYQILGEKNRSDKLLEEASRERAMRMAQESITPEMMQRVLAGNDPAAEAEFAAAQMRASRTPEFSHYTRGALDMQKLRMIQDARAAGIGELGVLNGNLAALEGKPIERTKISGGIAYDPYTIGGSVRATPIGEAEIRDKATEVFDNGSGVYSVDKFGGSATPITVGDLPALGDVQSVYAALGDSHGFQTTSIGRTPQENARANGVPNSQHLGANPTARDWSVRGKSPEEIKAFISDLHAKGFEAFQHDAGSGMHVHAELPPGSRAGAPSLLSGKPGGGASDKAPSGYRFKADGTLEAIPGGPADKVAGGGGRPLPTPAVTSLTKDADKLVNLDDLISSYKSDYGDYKFGGMVMNQVGRLTGSDQARWWQQYDRMKNVIRNELFGSALTPTEQAAFDQADINPNMDSGIIRSNLAMQRNLIDKALTRKAKVWAAQGYNRDAIEQATGVVLGDAPSAGSSGSWSIREVK